MFLPVRGCSMRRERLYLQDIIAVHAYFAVQWDIVWATATDDVPRLRRHVLKIVQAEDVERPEQ